jgi:DNA-binding NarL/FixJ family response regulator
MAKSVLIAESNTVFLEVLAGSLSLLGFDVVGTTSQMSDLISLASETKPDLLIFDTHISDETASFSDLQHLKELMPGMKIIAMGYHEAIDEIMEKFLGVGLNGYWSKYDNEAGLLRLLKLVFS